MRGYKKGSEPNVAVWDVFCERAGPDGRTRLGRFFALADAVRCVDAHLPRKGPGVSLVIAPARVEGRPDA